VTSVQEGLRGARETLLQRDPMVAARDFARQAAGQLATTQPGADGNPRAPDDILASLRRAWDDPIHRAAEARLSGAVPAGPSARAAVSDAADAVISGWNRSRRWRGLERNAANDQADPTGFEEQLNAYFQVLSGHSPSDGK
jgi:hypothetical protein